MNNALPQVKPYSLFARNGRRIRTATMVILPDGREVKFMDKMSKREALAQAK